MQFKSQNIFTKELLKTYNYLSSIELEEKLQNTLEANIFWRLVPLKTRIEKCLALADLIDKQYYELAKWASIEMGKPITQAEGEVKKCAFVCRYYAKNIEIYLKSKSFDLEGFKAEVVYEPLGTIFGIMPWNYPFWQVFRYALPALLSGNTVLLKHAPNLPQCALAIENLFLEAGFDNNVFQNLLIGHNQAEKVMKDNRVSAITFTGSAKAGRIIGSIAGSALKKSVLELGGSDPFIVLKDADLDKTAKFAVASRFNNAGQICIASKRWIVDETIADKFLAKTIEHIKKWTIGNPLLRETAIGPMARFDLKQQLIGQVQKSIEMGANVLFGNLEKSKTDNNFFSPMILGNIKKEMPAACEELFGPVATFYTFKTEEEAINLANDTQYGLGAAIWTEDRKKAKLYASQIATGTVAINGTVSSHPALPFGGVKNSGYGRELGLWGIYEFVNVKTVTIR